MSKLWLWSMIINVILLVSLVSSGIVNFGLIKSNTRLQKENRMIYNEYIAVHKEYESLINVLQKTRVIR
jgi:hypothetical protein